MKGKVYVIENTNLLISSSQRDRISKDISIVIFTGSSWLSLTVYYFVILVEAGIYFFDTYLSKSLQSLENLVGYTNTIDFATLERKSRTFLIHKLISPLLRGIKGELYFSSDFVIIPENLYQNLRKMKFSLYSHRFYSQI